jgi:hypothetical protein
MHTKKQSLQLMTKDAVAQTRTARVLADLGGVLEPVQARKT